VTIRNRKTKVRWPRSSVVVLSASMLSVVFALSLGFSACSWLKKDEPGEYIAVEDQTQRPDTPTSIQVSYAKSTDTLQSVIVSQFTGAAVLRTSGSGDSESSLVRFDGGVPTWRFHAARSVLNPLSALEKTPYHVTSFEYGKVPAGFEQDAPETGPPPPLYAGGYYIFSITRASGAVSYQAVRVRPDLTLEAYDADPRAGTSYNLCCSVSTDFIEPTPSDLGQPNTPLTTTPDSEQP
jgi:hypothetical protein